METLVQARADFLQVVGKAYDLIGIKLSAELDEENTARIPRRELQKLKEDSARCKGLGLENLRLAGELEICERLAVRVEELERNNKRLQRELEAALQTKQKIFSTPARARQLPGNPVSTSIIQDPSSTQRVIPDGSKFVSGETYDILARKHNNLYEQWKHQKSKRDEFEAVCTRQKETLKTWEELVGKQTKQLEKKDDRIIHLKGDLERLKSVTGNAYEESREFLAHQTVRSSLALPLVDSARSSSGPVAAMTPNSDVRRSDQIESANAAQIPIAIPSSCLGPGSGIKPGHQKSLEPPVGLKGGPDFLSTTVHDRIVIHDEEETDAEFEISLPKLPNLREQIGFPERHHSGSTEDDHSPKIDRRCHEGPLKIGPPSSPVVVSTRRVRKRKAKQVVTKVKLEIGSSSPADALRSGDSLDLDDIGEKVNTPKKLRRLANLSRERRAHSQDTQSSKEDKQVRLQRQLRAVSEQISQETPSRTGSVLQPLNVNKQILPKALDGREPKRRRIIGDSAIRSVAEDSDIFATATTEQSERLVELLEKPSPAKTVLSRSTRLLSSAKRHSKQPAGAGLVVHHEEAQVAQSARHISPALPSETFGSKSNNLSTPTSRGSSKMQNPLFQALTKGSVSILNPSPRGTPNTMTTTKSPINSRISDSAILTPRSSTGTPAEPSYRTSLNATRKPQPRTKRKAQEWEHNPEQEPLRLRPVESLLLEDFKINANYNQGYNYAFKEVVRDKDERSALHACTKPGCCGDKFRALAMAGRNFDNSPTTSQEEADEKLLRDFLGANAWKISTMSKAEREATWLQARTRQLANEHGKHRHAYERPVSPPGFWRADFPTTQEELADREKAKEEYRDQVRQRYEEAMRENGAFIFRDE